MKLFETFFKNNGSKFPECGEPVILFCKYFSKDFKAANMNIVKTALECTQSTIESCGAGPRICRTVISDLIPKVSSLFQVVVSN